MKIGHKLIEHNFRFLIQNGPNLVWKDISTERLFKDKKIILFGLPGAFTPMCHQKHLPGYDNMFEQFKELGYDDVYCVSVNDAYVMNAWVNNLLIKNVLMIPDGCGTFTKSMGMLVNKPRQGFGYRSWRYSSVINNCVVEEWFEEPGINNESNDKDPMTVSLASYVYKFLKDKKQV